MASNERTTVTTAEIPTISSPVVLIRPPQMTQTSHSSHVRVTTPASVGRVGQILTPAGQSVGGGGGFVLRGNQLVRMPARGPMPAEAGISPLQVRLVSASGLVKQQPFVAGGPQFRAAAPGAVDPKTKQPYQLVSSQGNPQVVVVNSGVQGARGNRVQTKSAAGARGESPLVVDEQTGLTGLQTLTLSAALKRGSRMAGQIGRKPCNCTKSQCLKLYCECFANGEFCRNCNCTNCHNNLAYENERSKSIKTCLERNPYAFQPKIGRGRMDIERLHNKGCNCKKSNCLKNYCECYEAKVGCTPRCKCVGCRNTESDRLNKFRGTGGLQSLASAASILAGTGPQAPDSRRSTDSPATEASYDKPDPKKMPWYYMTDDVVEATSLCLLAKAEQMEFRATFTETEMQREILKEFGRCLQQIIGSATN